MDGVFWFSVATVAFLVLGCIAEFVVKRLVGVTKPLDFPRRTR